MVARIKSGPRGQGSNPAPYKSFFKTCYSKICFTTALLKKERKKERKEGVKIIFKSLDEHSHGTKNEMSYLIDNCENS